MRFLADIPEEDVKWLDEIAREQNKSRAAVLREAVSAYRAEAGPEGIRKYFGIWKDRKDIGDGVEYQRRLRAEWTREWDPDYEEVKKEYPELFQDDAAKPEAAE